VGEWIAIVVLLFFSACFSGLNLGLMSLDMSGLEIVANGSDETNARYARAILPVRQHHNWLLTTLLLGNVMVNSLISILLADKTTGVVGFLVSTAAIVLLGEVFPQALSSRYPLYVGYHSLYLVYFFMAVLYVVARPLSLLLDCILGAPIGTIYAHAEFGHLVEMHRDHGVLDEDQTKIMKGALDFKHSVIEECMTPIETLYSLEIDDVVDRKKMKEIFTSGYSRIPVHNKTKDKTVGMILTKDLILVDPRHGRTVGEVAEIFERTPLFFKPTTSLGRALTLFKQGRSHCAVVEDTDASGHKHSVGFVTLEDVLEELLDSEIQDETEDVVHQRFITMDPSFSESSEHQPSKKMSAEALAAIRRKGGQSPELLTEANRKFAKLGKIQPEEDISLQTIAIQPKKKKTTVIRKLTPANRLTRVLTDVSNVLADKMQQVVKEPQFLTSLGLSLSDTDSLAKLSIHLSGEVDVGSVTLASPWYAPVRDSYSANFMLSALPRAGEDQVQHNGVSRRIVFNSEDALREPALANDVVHPVLKRTASDPSMVASPRKAPTSDYQMIHGLGRASISSSEEEVTEEEMRRDMSLRARSKSIDQYEQ
jgi:metal transporter CNNM